MAAGSSERGDERDALVALIESEVADTADYTGRPKLRPAVLDAMRAVPREEFVPPEEAYAAYANVPLPIGHFQTISQPYVVALMTDLLDPEPGDVMLEIGTGSGYQAAVLSTLVSRVYSLEVVPQLAASAAERLVRLGYDNVVTREGDGNLGWPDHAPYDGIVVTAGAREVPPALIDQLKPGAALVIPVDAGFSQMLRRITRDPDGDVHTEDVLPVAFVPLVKATEEGFEQP
jgi:protein-L-isoaspartate(D-aspartate) O-methyltransferase